MNPDCPKTDGAACNLDSVAFLCVSCRRYLKTLELAKGLGMSNPDCVSGCNLTEPITKVCESCEAYFKTLGPYHKLLKPTDLESKSVDPKAGLDPKTLGSKTISLDSKPIGGTKCVKTIELLTTGVKHDKGKVRMDLLSGPALVGLSRILTHGAHKYADHNWRGGFKWSRLIGAAMRHLICFMCGQNNDPDSGLPHIDHLACCVMFLSEHQKVELGTDDRHIVDLESMDYESEVPF